MSVYRGKVTAVSPGRLIDVLLDDYGKPTIGTLVELVELPAADEVRRELADVTSERDYLRERLRELVDQWATEADRLYDDSFDFVDRPTDRALVVGRADGVSACSVALARIVTEAETGRNRTATPGGQDAPTPERPT